METNHAVGHSPKTRAACIERVLYLVAGAFAATAIGSALAISPVLAICAAIVLAWAGTMIRERASAPVLAAPSSPVADPPERRIFFDADLPASFFTGESERARQIAAGAHWARGSKDAESDSDPNDDLSRFAIGNLHADNPCKLAANSTNGSDEQRKRHLHLIR
jgi:hypothetical protein